MNSTKHKKTTPSYKKVVPKLIVKGLVDKKKALEMGEKWREFSFNNIE